MMGPLDGGPGETVMPGGSVPDGVRFNRLPDPVFGVAEGGGCGAGGGGFNPSAPSRSIMRISRSRSDIGGIVIT